MNTDEIMQIGLDLGGMNAVPADSGIWFPGSDLRRVLVGIDVGVPELLLARQLGFDAVIAHHPIRRAGFWRVFLRHRELLSAAGVPEEAIAAAIEARAAAMRLTEPNNNDDHVASVARLLRMPFLNIHLPLDEYTRRVLVRTAAECQELKRSATAADVAGAFGGLPSFARAGALPQVVYGDPDQPAGRILVSIAAGTNGGFRVASACLRNGVDTLVYMHVGPEDLQRMSEERFPGALIVTGHMAGDSVGVDALVMALRRRGLEVETFSGVDTPLG
jgi:hypothetical protein